MDWRGWPKVYPTRGARVTDKCDRCSRDDIEETETIHLENDYDLCKGCVRDLESNVTSYDWQDRYTEEQHERAISLLEEVEEIECVISSYEDGQIVIHTPYVSSDVVADFCNHFGLRIVKFGPRWNLDSTWPCVDHHDSMFEVVLSYDHRSPPPIPISVEFVEQALENLGENDRQF